MKYYFQNKIFDTLEEAENFANPIIQQFLTNEDYRFSVAKEIINGNDTTWTSADLINDEENYSYFVFNTITGLHEKVNSKTEAINKLNEVKQQFIQFSQMFIEEIDDLTALNRMEALLKFNAK